MYLKINGLTLIHSEGFEVESELAPAMLEREKRAGPLMTWGAIGARKAQGEE